MIQFPTSPTNRAAIALRPPWYRTATTVARASSEPSEFNRRSRSSNSSGNVDANSTSCGVPNSMTVCSCSRRRPADIVVTRTGMRTAVADGKSSDSFSTHVGSARTETVCASRDTGMYPYSPLDPRCSPVIVPPSEEFERKRTHREHFGGCTEAAKDLAFAPILSCSLAYACQGAEGARWGRRLSLTRIRLKPALGPA